MILPTKHIRADRSLLGVGADILPILNEPKTISRIWEEFRSRRARHPNMAPITYSWFVLALDLLYLLNAVDYEGGRLQRVPTS